ncbi:MAG: glycerol-3-phosphate 1-O-acyltransferase PlsY [Burkholderiaceae bacterium]|nr:glycerol-3-phosphate 1-O-acyltransferase PlsY [Burkholderiaceae bacterium]
MEALYSLLAIVLAYLLGSVSFAVLVSRGMGLADPRTFGSKNPGATNVLRSGNKWAAALTLIGDGAKGWLAVVLARYLGARYGFGPETVALVGIAVFVGHLYPVFHGFAGGKGVATAGGVLFGINPILGLATVVAWVIIAYFFRYSSLAALVSAAFAPLFYVFVFGADVTVFTIVAMSVLLLYRHWDNFGRLMAGKEKRIGGGQH